MTALEETGKFDSMRPHTVIVWAPALMAAAAVSTSLLAAIATAVGCMEPVTGVTGVPLMNEPGKVTVMVSAVPVLTRGDARLKPITIFRLAAATRSAVKMVSVGAVTAPPMEPVVVEALLQSRVVET